MDTGPSARGRALRKIGNAHGIRHDRLRPTAPNPEGRIALPAGLRADLTA
jgi:hypothetical protein